MFVENDRVLIILAHPDDEVLGCGGLIAKYAENIHFKVLIIGEGSSPRFRQNQDEQIQNAISQRTEFMKDAMNILKVNDYELNHIKCGCFSTSPILEINQIIEKSIMDFSPNYLITHFSHDNNNDHRIVSRSVDMAARPKEGSKIKGVLHCEIQSSTDWTFGEIQFLPNIFISISESNLRKKLQAMACYKTEFDNQVASRSESGLETLAKYRGLQSGFTFAEAYRLHRLNVSTL